MRSRSPAPVRPVTPEFRFWSPPADPDKPPCPYRTGFTVDIKPHIPPAPFGGQAYGSTPRAIVSQYDLRTLRQTELVLANPPLETADPPTSQIHTLSVTRELAVADDRDAQLVLCNIKPKSPVDDGLPFQAVAKIYDPLYYSFPHKDVPSVPCDVTWSADQDYSREAAAYEHLQTIGQAGSFAPKYFGSWTFALSLQMGNATKQTPPQSRPVRLILIEYIPGKSLRELCAGPAPIPASTFSEAYRLEVLARILDGEAMLRFKGINQRDLAARNVILFSDEQMEAQPEEFNNPIPPRSTPVIPYDGTTLPPNPMWTYWKDDLQGFDGWIPTGWETNSRLRQEWLKERFGGDNLTKYAPIREELEFDEYSAPEQLPTPLWGAGTHNACQVKPVLQEPPGVTNLSSAVHMYWDWNAQRRNNDDKK
ncbi:hypothetical protein B0J18DRAFT_475635 [Chaetomium sp. MPI-SDFR-AT-0129]|nr:hypothetical protein B0J18DRAFT_475635 [Chaetomium sp. MPI-SDFR-AT-0129]